MRRIVLVALPIAAVITVAIGVFYLFNGMRMLAAGRMGLGIGFLVFGGMGVALAWSLFRLRRHLLLGAVVLAAMAFGAAPASAQQSGAADTMRVHVLRTKGGSTSVGRIVRADVDSIRFETTGGVLSIARSDVEELRDLGRGATIREGELWPASPNVTRLFFAPTGRMLERGERYFSDIYLLLLNVAGGITDRVTFGGGFSVVPTDDFTDNVFYITPKVGLYSSDNINVAAGALAGFSGSDAAGTRFGIAYGVATFGEPDGSVTIGGGMGYADDRWQKHPLILLGGERRITRRSSLLTENYFTTANGGEVVVSYGVRFFGERLSADLAFWQAPGEAWRFPGIPYVAFAVRF